MRILNKNIIDKENEQVELMGWRLGIEVDTNFIVALLVVMGFSVHDTIVVFDRIRENLSLQKKSFDLTAIINNSVNQTFSRSINTSLTLVLTLLALFFFRSDCFKIFYFNNFSWNDYRHLFFNFCR